MEKGRKKKPLPTRRTMIVAFVLTALFAAKGGRIEELNRGTLLNLQKERNER